MEQKGAAAGGLKKLLAVSGFLVAGIFNLKSGIGDFVGNKKAIMVRMRMHDHVMYLVNYQSVAHLEVLNYQSSSSYFTLRTGVISRAMDTLIFYS